MVAHVLRRSAISPLKNTDGIVWPNVNDHNYSIVAMATEYLYSNEVRLQLLHDTILT